MTDRAAPRGAADDEAVGQVWDAVIVGTGIGGATLGHALARAGWRVLFCERGRAALPDDARRGGYAAEPVVRRLSASDRQALLGAGRYPDVLLDDSEARPRRFVPFIGAGAGGSSALFGMAMERFFPEDFEPRRKHPDVADAALPEAWPVSYDEMAPHYAAAERLYRLSGGGDPLRARGDEARLRAPPPLTARGQRMVDLLEGKGLHPYRVPMACEFVPECECCQGQLCPRACKNDSRRVCLEPALAEHGARLVDDCEVVRLDATGDRVDAVIAQRHGRRLTLRGRVVVLAAGALETPRLLLGSASARWPHGLANGSKRVGRCLMRHYNDLYAIDTADRTDNRRKEIAFSDFYLHQGRGLGTVQSFGRLPPVDVLLQSLRNDLDAGPWRAVAPALSLVAPVLRRVLARLVDTSTVLASVTEDLPYEDNHVALPTGATSNGPRLAIRYRLRPRERERIAAMRALMAQALKPNRFRLIRQAENNAMLAHACGTCRFGDDPATSVLDRNNRAHGIDNLYVVDSSFFPSSAGINPALTVAANALRVATNMLGGDRRG